MKTSYKDQLAEGIIEEKKAKQMVKTIIFHINQIKHRKYENANSV